MKTMIVFRFYNEFNERADKSGFWTKNYNIDDLQNCLTKNHSVSQFLLTFIYTFKLLSEMDIKFIKNDSVFV